MRLEEVEVDEKAFAEQVFQFLVVRLEVYAEQDVPEWEDDFNSLWCD